MGPDISAQGERILDALADNLHRLFFHDHHGLSDDERKAAAVKAIGIALAQVGAANINDGLAGAHPQLKARIDGLRAESPKAFV